MTSYKYLVSVDELIARLSEPTWKTVDCRFDLMHPEKGYGEYQRDHIPGAQYAHLDKDLAGPVSGSTGRHPLPSVEVFSRTLSAWGIDNNSQVIVYDHASGATAARLWWMLRWVGHERVAILDGGYAAWQNAGQPVSDQEELVARGRFRPLPDSRTIASTEEIQALLGAGEALTIVDARDRQRFAGKSEPIDSVAGHVPGAMNFPYFESLNADGRWKSPEELKAAWTRLLGQAGHAPWITMCGSGVTACHLVLSARLAGLPEPRLYIGSWSEWIRDPARPVTRDKA
jgi:thiosulfate/3-mercaptopyruvate sulfurtransferase